MKFHNYIIPSILFGACVLFTACSDDIERPLPTPENKTFSGTSLHLYYDGTEMPGKYIAITPASDNAHATLTLGGDIDLSSLSMLKMKGTIPTTGVLPGDAVYNLPIVLSPAGDHYTFSGAGNTRFLSFSYNGTLYADSISLYLDNIKLINTSLAGSAWQPVAAVRNDDLISFSSSPFHVVWDVQPIDELKELQIPLADLLQLALNAPVVPVYNNTAYASIAELYFQIIQSLAFRDNGDAIIRYLSSANGATQLVTANANTVQYLIDSPEEMRLYLNPLSLFSIYLTNKGNGYSGPETITWKTVKQYSADSQSINQSEEDILLQKLLPTILPALAEGLPQHYVVNGDSLSIYANTELSAKLLTGFVLPLLQDETTMQLLKQTLATQPSLAHYSKQIETAVSLLPVVAQHTTRFELGFNFSKITSTPTPQSPLAREGVVQLHPIAHSIR